MGDDQVKLQRTNLRLLAASLLWLGAIGVGLGIVWQYENTPGRAAAPPQHWPTASCLEPAADRPSLVMLAHPRCPCTRASIGELALLMAHAQGRVRASVLFYKPAGAPEAWAQTDLWQSAAAIPGVQVRLDEDGAEARHFNSTTSGQVVLYDAAGRLLFHGGITGARGHSGDNEGRSAVLALLARGAAARSQSNVFGCSLFAAPGAGQAEEVQICNQ